MQFSVMSQCSLKYTQVFTDKIQQLPLDLINKRCFRKYIQVFSFFLLCTGKRFNILGRGIYRKGIYWILEHIDVDRLNETDACPYYTEIHGTNRSVILSCQWFIYSCLEEKWVQYATNTQWSPAFFSFGLINHTTCLLLQNNTSLLYFWLPTRVAGHPVYPSVCLFFLHFFCFQLIVCLLLKFLVNPTGFLLEAIKEQSEEGSERVWECMYVGMYRYIFMYLSLPTPQPAALLHIN